MYPVDVSVYDWAVAQGWFVPKREYQQSGAFQQGFSSASQPHWHYRDGALCE